MSDLRLRLENTERQLSKTEAEHRDTSAALREELALRGSQLADLNSQLLQAKRTIVEQEVSRRRLSGTCRTFLGQYVVSCWANLARGICLESRVSMDFEFCDDEHLFT